MHITGENTVNSTFSGFLCILLVKTR